MRKKEIIAAKLSAELVGCGPEQIVKAAMDTFRPVASFVGVTGGKDSITAGHWSSKNVEGSKGFLANVGIGIKSTYEHVRNVCADWKMPLTEIRAKEDCGQDYDVLVKAHGFPGPAMHYKMFQRLKERPMWKLLAANKKERHDNVMLITGIRQDESKRRSGYKYSVIDFVGNMMFVNPFYYWDSHRIYQYIYENGLEVSPASRILGMSGECCCGAYAHQGELAKIKIVDPELHDRIKTLEIEVRKCGHNWGWEQHPPKQSSCRRTIDMFMPFCVGCEKGHGTA